MIDHSDSARAPEPRVTVAVPSYNQAQFLDATLRSIFAQPVAVEVMLADGGSTDGSQRVIERWRDRLTWFRSAPDAGQPASINEAIARGRAPYVCWLNSDDLFLPEGLAALLAAIEADPSIAVVYGGCLRIDAGGRIVGRYRAGRMSVRALSRRCVIPQPASLIRRDAWERIGGLRDKLHLGLDYDLWWRLQGSGFRFRRIDTDVAALRVHAGAKSFKYAREMYAEAKAIVRMHYGSVPLVWRLKEPFSIAARRQAGLMARLARALHGWSLR
jgi:GT2 family glycosyltransferase